MERMAFQWAANMPLVTRCWCIASIATAVMISVNLISFEDTLFSSRLVWKDKQVWRIPLSLAYVGDLDMNLFYSLLQLVTISGDLEGSLDNAFEYVWLIATTSLIQILVDTIRGKYSSLSSQILTTLLYFWAKRRPDAELRILIVVGIRASYYCLLSILTYFFLGDERHLLSIAIGHVVFYSYEIAPSVLGINPLAPPWTQVKPFLEARERWKKLRAIREHRE
ncbi:derlin CYBJADRAFT_165894 [Cyberlindnera jadinii NRRL Y-1542]|uniref:Derlin n=1 Tax=Cyberlindnera jadinii (strain ATCC 18201 / CBS 1600 / BCRC 20928 / JCM 3617 / NBRC 0987 / NRRL Y-1542) TaxID=983966 RepID=A0A1E4S6P4_CYBJN|nr:hypothetical protein CYBJADRAFT_165894 [Cyberlindnera jadinii NRRL Y-1542]ODV75140.1 hypothetical protein CYBJADRAFT_165894 [Cyberlindnera jadinii NRRL Y-1542]